MAADWVPVVSAVSASLLGLGGLGFGWSNARAERQARVELATSELTRQRRLSQDGREYEAKRVVYEELIYVLGLVLLDLEYRVPSVGRLVELVAPGKDRTINSDLASQFNTPMEPPDRGDLLRLASKVATFGSPTLSSKVEEFLRRYYACLRRLQSLRAAFLRLTTRSPDESEPSPADLVIEALHRVDEIEQARRAVREAEHQEAHSLPFFQEGVDDLISRASYLLGANADPWEWTPEGWREDEPDREVR